MTVLVSFLCPTFGRAARQPWLLREAVYWFTQQSIVDMCELVILNDAPDQEIVCRTPGVKVVNLPARLQSLGEKMNVLVSMASGKVCCPCEDDDISLPNRAAQALLKLEGCDYWTPGLRFYEERGKPLVADRNGCCHHASAFRRDRFLWRYPHVSKGHDQIVEAWARDNVRFNPHRLTDPVQITYVYRWGVSNFHLSGQQDMEQAYAEATPGPPGTYVVEPVMDVDYRVLAARAIEKRMTNGTR